MLNRDRVGKVLVIKIGAIGDILMATPALRALKKTYPKAQVSLLIGASAKEAIKRNRYVDELIEIDDVRFFRGSLAQRIGLVWDILRCLRTRKYDTVIILHRDWRYNLFATMCGALERIGFKKGSWGDIWLTKGTRIDGVQHHIYQYLELVRQCGAAANGNGMDFFVTAESRKKAKELLSAHQVNQQRLVGISPGGARNAKLVMDSKRWPLEKYAELIRSLEKNGFNVVLFGSKTDAYLIDSLPLGCGGVNAIGKTSLEETAALMTMCRVVVTHDSGPMHLAVAVGAPVVGLFGPTDPREYHPLSKQSHYYWKNEGLACAPCFKDGVFPHCETVECMQRITPLEVYNKVVEIATSTPFSFDLYE